MTSINQNLLRGSNRSGVSKEQTPESEVAEKIKKAKQARKDGQALRAG